MIADPAVVAVVAEGLRRHALGPYVLDPVMVATSGDPLLTPDEVKKILMSTARDLGPKGHDSSFGAGLVDALQAVMAAKPDRLPPGPAVSQRR